MELADLKRVALFADLVHTHLKQILSIAEERVVKAGEHICKDGDPADCLFFVIKGRVRISKMIPGVGEEALSVLNVGDYFGEMALIDDKPRSADAIANTTVTLGVIPKPAFEDMLFTNKDLAYDLLWTLVRTLGQRLRESNEKMRAFLAMAGKF